MPKGKKYDAAEKHFYKLRQEYNIQIKQLRERTLALSKDNARLRVDNAILTDQVDRLAKDIEELEKLLGMPKEEIERAARIGMSMDMLHSLCGGRFI